MPKIDTPSWNHGAGGAHPAFGQDNGPYAEIALGEAAGLRQVGVRLERLPSGSRSSHRHWHEAEDELVYVLSGELVLVEDVETTLCAGDAAAWAAGAPIAHCLENRSSEEATMLVVGARAERDVVHYPDHGLVLTRDAEGARLTKEDGSSAGD